MRLSRRFDGYTLIELMVVLAIIGLTLILLVPGADSTNRTDRLGNETRELANNIRTTQTQSYTIATGTNGGSGCPANAQGHVYWRGDVLEVDSAANAINMYLLCGNDLSAFAGNNNETVGITGKQPYKSISLSGLTISEIDYYGTGCSPFCTPAQASLAFLAPEGRNYDSQGLQNPSSANNTPYTDRVQVVLKVKDAGAPNLTGIVTIDGTDGKIDSSVQ